MIYLIFIRNNNFLSFQIDRDISDKNIRIGRIIILGIQFSIIIDIYHFSITQKVFNNSFA